jgi:hypothetical protein
MEIIDIVFYSGCKNARARFANGEEVRIIGGAASLAGVTKDNMKSSFVEGNHAEYGKFLFRKSEKIGSLLDGTLMSAFAQAKGA